MPLSTLFARWGKTTYIKTGMITDKQNTKATDNVTMIFSLTCKLLKMTTERAEINNAIFLKLMTVTKAPNPSALAGVI
jgi:hypothetical protein